jgi:hypothetical protein
MRAHVHVRARACVCVRVDAVTPHQLSPSMSNISTSNTVRFASKCARSSAACARASFSRCGHMYTPTCSNPAARALATLSKHSLHQPFNGSCG